MVFQIDDLPCCDKKLLMSHSSIRLLNNNCIYNAKYCQMAFRSLSDGAPISPNQPSFGIHGQSKVSGDRQRETTHEICCVADELPFNKNFDDRLMME